MDFKIFFVCFFLGSVLDNLRIREREREKNLVDFSHDCLKRTYSCSSLLDVTCLTWGALLIKAKL